MKIQTKLTGFFIIVLAAFSYALVWISTMAYRQEVNRLNVEVSEQRLAHIVNILEEQNNLLSQGIFLSLEEAQKRALLLIRHSEFARSSSYDKSFPFVIGDDSRLLYRPLTEEQTVFPWSHYSVNELMRKGHGELRFYSTGGERTIKYTVFRPWRWLICYSYPSDAIFHQEIYGAYFRQIIAVICCMLVAVATLFWLIQKALSPLDDLVESASAMAAGVFPEPGVDKRYSKDEIGILNKAFADMADKIRESINQLRGEVRERRAKEEEIRELIENSPLAIAVVKADWSYSINEMFTAVFGFDEVDFKTFDAWFDLSRPGGLSRQQCLDLWQDIFKCSTPRTLQVRCKNGRILDIEVRHRRISDQHLLVFNDLTEIKEAEKEIRDTRNYLNQLFNSIRIYLVAVDEKGVIAQWNRAIEKFTGIPAADAVGQKIWLLVPFMKNYRHDVEQTINSREDSELYHEIVLFQKRRYYLNISVTPLQGRDKPGAVIMLEDVTELVRKSEQLMQAQKMETVGTLTGGLAHDFNNVLGGIKGALSMIRYHVANNPDKIDEIREFSALAERSVTRAANIVEQLLTLSRKSQLSFQRVDLNETLTHVLEICRGTFDKRVSIRVSKPAGKALVKADTTQVEQILLNLLINAEQSMTSMREDGENIGGDIEITIAMARPDPRLFVNGGSDSRQFWSVSIRDHGVGIAPDIIGKIFDPFFTTKARGKGSGLGLAMVYNIIDLHSGFVDVKSEPGTGSTFTVYLPAVSPGEEASRLSSDTQEIFPGEGLILLVDDEKAIRITAGKMLESAGYQVLSASDGEEGVELFQIHHRKITAVLMDIAMPRMSGDEAYEQMKAIDPNVKVLLSSGYTNDARIVKALESGASGFIRKPYSISTLSRKFYELLAK